VTAFGPARPAEPDLLHHTDEVADPQAPRNAALDVGAFPAAASASRRLSRAAWTTELRRLGRAPAGCSTVAWVALGAAGVAWAAVFRQPSPPKGSGIRMKSRRPDSITLDAPSALAGLPRGVVIVRRPCASVRCFESVRLPAGSSFIPYTAP
jgi:hypothetical protein